MFSGLRRSIGRGISGFGGVMRNFSPGSMSQFDALGSALGQKRAQSVQPDPMSGLPNLGLTKNSAQGPSGQAMGQYLGAYDQVNNMFGQSSPMQSAVRQRRIMTKGGY